MVINSMAFEWLNPMFGGALISISLSVFVLINNKNCGVGDMVRNALERGPSESWNNQILFLIGLIVSPVIFSILFYPVTSGLYQDKPLIVIASGLLVGIGYSLCNGGLLTRTILVSNYNVISSVIVLLLILLFGGISRSILALM